MSSIEVPIIQFMQPVTRLTTSEKLTGNNWTRWLKEFKRLAAEYEFNSLIKGTFKGTKEQELISDSRYYNAIYDNCSEIVRALLESKAKDPNILSGAEAMAILEKHYTTINNAALAGCLVQLFELKYQGSLEEYIGAFRSIITEMALTHGEPLSERQKLAILIKALPDEFNTFKRAWNVKKKGEFTIEDAFSDLENSDQFKTANIPSNHVNIKPEPQIFKAEAKKQCRYCKKEGHVIENCWKRDPNLHPNNRSFGNARNPNKHQYEKTNLAATKMDTTTLQTDDTKAEIDRMDREMKSFAYSSVTPMILYKTSHDVVIDSGASHCICNDITKFIDYKEQFGVIGTALQGASLQCEGIGTIVLHVRNDHGDIIQWNVPNTYYAPNASETLISVSATNETKNNLICLGQTNQLLITNKDGTQTCIPIRQCNRQYLITTYTSIDSNTVKNETLGDKVYTTASLDRWHEILGHADPNMIQKLQQHVNGMKISDKNNPSCTCTTCVMAKMPRKKFKKHHEHRATRPLFRVHTDIAGPLTPVAHNGDEYALIFVDDATRFVAVYTIPSKDQAINGFKRFVAEMGVTEQQIRVLRSDNGTEFCNKEFEKYLLDLGILHETTNTYTPSENGVAERTWRILFNMTRAMLILSGLDAGWWYKALKMAAYIRNRILSSALPGKTPYEAMFGKKPDLSHMHPFGSPVFVKHIKR